MAIQQTRGKAGEDMAVGYLQRAGYTILTRNWRYRRYEVDMIARKNGIIRIVEIKTRHGTRYGMPEESMTQKKFQNLKHAAAYLQSLYPWCKRIQFDVLCINIKKEQQADFLLIEDFYL